MILGKFDKKRYLNVSRKDIQYISTIDHDAESRGSYIAKFKIIYKSGLLVTIYQRSSYASIYFPSFDDIKPFIEELYYIHMYMTGNIFTKLWVRLKVKFSSMDINKVQSQYNLKA